MSEIGLDVGLANELKLAFRRHNYTPQYIQRLKEGDVLGQVLGVLRGTHEIKPLDNVIDLESPCKLPFDGAVRMSPAKFGVLKIVRCGDTLFLDGKPINIFFSEKQKNGKVIGFPDLHKEVCTRGGNVSAKVLDHLVVHPELWPESWKKDAQGNTLYVTFWDDIFLAPRPASYMCVRYGCWGNDEVLSWFQWLHLDFDGDNPAASLLAS